MLTNPSFQWGFNARREYLIRAIFANAHQEFVINGHFLIGHHCRDENWRVIDRDI